MLAFIRNRFYRKEEKTNEISPRIRQLSNKKWVCLIKDTYDWKAVAVGNTKITFTSPEFIEKYCLFDTEYEAVQAFAHYSSKTIEDEIKELQK